jgi:hypothetical protein
MSRQRVPRRPVARLAGALLLCCAPTPARADVIVSYDFTGAVLTPSTTAADANASAVNFVGSSASGTTTSERLNVIASTAALTAETAVSSNSYFQFDVTPASGFSLDLQTLQFKANNNIGLPGTVAGYAFKVIVGDDEYELADSDKGQTFPAGVAAATYSIDLSSIPLITATANFRIFTYSNQADFPVTHAVYDDIVLTGQIAAVPEASTFYFLGLAAACCGVWKRLGGAWGA